MNQIRDIGNTHRRTLECLLLMNIFIEKIFLFLWFWLIMVISVTSASLIYWVTFTFLRCIRQSFIRAAVLSSTTSPQNLLSRQQQLTQKNFQDEWLKHDGLLLLHFVSLNSSKNLAAQLIDLLYKGFQDWKSDHSGSRKIAVKVTEDVDTLWYNSSSADSRLARNQV